MKILVAGLIIQLHDGLQLAAWFVIECSCENNGLHDLWLNCNWMGCMMIIFHHNRVKEPLWDRDLWYYGK